MEDITFVNNIDIYENMNIIHFIRDVGVKFRMSSLLSRDSVKSRLNSESGMSFTEFSYQLFQAYDFYHLYKNHDCSFQIGGSDQWGNIASGIDFISTNSQSASNSSHNKRSGDQLGAFGVTVNLLTDSNGEKLGKSTGNALMLDPKVNAPYNFYQFFIN